MSVCLLILERIMGHPLPLEHIFLLQDLVVESGSAIHHRHQHEHEDRAEVRESAPKQFLTYYFHGNAALNALNLTHTDLQFPDHTDHPLPFFNLSLTAHFR